MGTLLKFCFEIEKGGTCLVGVISKTVNMVPQLSLSLLWFGSESKVIQQPHAGC